VEKKLFLRWSLTFDPVLPAREVAVAYLNQAGFTMFEPHENGVLAHGVKEEIDMDWARSLVEEIRDFAVLELVEEEVVEENWNAQWENDYPQVVVYDEQGGVLCTLRAPFHPQPSQGLDVLVVPQMSFGTGHHATTYLMTRQLMALDLQGQHVLDMGCGTGVLAMIARLRGAANVWGIDIEKSAVDNAEANAALNGLSPDLASRTLQFLQGDGSTLKSLESGSCHVVLANIHKNVLLADMAEYARLLIPGGQLLLSGFFQGDLPAMEEGVVSVGLQVLHSMEQDGWACIHCGKPSPSL
jgi:ribosomal protein L11 methyltransferase